MSQHATHTHIVCIVHVYDDTHIQCICSCLVFNVCVLWSTPSITWSCSMEAFSNKKNGVLSFSSTDDDVLVMFHGHAPTPQPSKFWCKPVNDAGLPKRSASVDTRIGYQKTQSQLQMKRQQSQIKSKSSC